jgi:hypothetical protein
MLATGLLRSSNTPDLRLSAALTIRVSLCVGEQRQFRWDPPAVGASRIMLERSTVLQIMIPPPTSKLFLNATPAVED